ncbi:hypothetical protein HYC85_008437 [Camellia sinensis]|uniref:Uncharacterized protein n=1 Tax=Camellia sinensis TaxID=4442 RepID=A0A7J7HTI8_CAMSI|nr:hypothetical protein HYC85_008437 [Camellia sinensis]
MTNAYSHLPTNMYMFVCILTRKGSWHWRDLRMDFQVSDELYLEFGRAGPEL